MSDFKLGLHILWLAIKSRNAWHVADALDVLFQHPHPKVCLTISNKTTCERPGCYYCSYWADRYSFMDAGDDC